jgi:type 2 lantibiotic biosynthesis protein LanM
LSEDFWKLIAMQQLSSASVRERSAPFFAALTLAERMTLLRRAEPNWIGPRIDASRAAEAFARWRSQEPFLTGDYFEQRLRLEGMTEEDAHAVLGLRPEAYFDLSPTTPEWISVLQRLYFGQHPPEMPRQEFLEWAQQGTNALMWVAYPIINEALRRFGEGIFRQRWQLAPFDADTVDKLVLPALLRNLHSQITGVLILELNVARIKGLLAGSSPEERFQRFCEMLRQPETRQTIVREYPVLFRSLLTSTLNWVESSVELLERLSTDWNLIREKFAPGCGPCMLTAISTGAGDAHRGGRTVTILEFSSGLKIVYKPRSLSLDVHFGEFLEWVNEHGFEPRFRIVNVINRGNYGWSEFVASQQCSSSEEMKRFYRRLGGYLALFHSFRATDIHYENLIAAGEFPIPIDLETLFHPDVDEKEDPAAEIWQSSVMRVLLLPRRVLGSETQEGIDTSGLGAKSGQYYPAGMALSVEGRGTDEMHLVAGKGVRIEDSHNQPQQNGQKARIEYYLEPIVRGFEAVYRLLSENREELLRPLGVLERFAEDEVRFIGRDTRAYSWLLSKAFHPDMLRDAIDRDQMFDGLWLRAVAIPLLGRLIPAEAKDLHSRDVPVFISHPKSRDLWTSCGVRIPEVFEQTALERVHTGIHRLGEEDLALQSKFIHDSIISAGEQIDFAIATRNSRFSESQDAMELARAIGGALCREVIERDSYANWIGLTPVGPREIAWSMQPLTADFYSGLSGCAFFLAYLGALTGQPSYSKIARKSITLALRHLERRKTGRLGGYMELGGIAYTLAHLAVLWGDDSLLKQANTLAAEIEPLIKTDRTLDVLAGSAGCISVLEVLNAVNPNDRLLEIAVGCGERLLQQQLPQSVGAAWKTAIESSQPLTGFSHGAAGMAWALLKLARWSGDSRFRHGAETAIEYERSTFMSEVSNWPDYRSWEGRDPCDVRYMVAWCHGAPGIGLARIDSLSYTDDPKIREEIRIALNATAKANFGENHCLCHGDLGNLDILLCAAERVDKCWWSDVGSRIASETLAAISEKGPICGKGSVASLGLMTGLAGIGYGLLRLARPAQVPSVLVLAPPVLR